jgi:hypothetical protein
MAMVRSRQSEYDGFEVLDPTCSRTEKLEEDSVGEREERKSVSTTLVIIYEETIVGHVDDTNVPGKEGNINLIIVFGTEFLFVSIHSLTQTWFLLLQISDLYSPNPKLCFHRLKRIDLPQNHTLSYTFQISPPWKYKINVWCVEIRYVYLYQSGHLRNSPDDFFVKSHFLVLELQNRK